MSRNYTTFYVIIIDRKKEMTLMNENKTNINCLSMIYLTPLTNPYKIRKN